MAIEIKLNNAAGRIAWLLAGVIIWTALIFAVTLNLLVGLLTDPRVSPRKDLISAAIAYAPNSAGMNARLAEAEMSEDDRDIAAADDRANRAVNLSPWDYQQWLLLARVKEAQGDRVAAEAAVQKALTLAPNYTDVHWRMANLLLREGKLARSVAEFRVATSSNPALLNGSLDLLWRVSGGSLAVVQNVTPSDSSSQLSLAQFLLKQSRVPDAITVFSGIGRDALNVLPSSSQFIDSMISSGRLEEARGLWIGLVSGAYAQPGHPLPLIWNGSFESDISTRLTQFDWLVSRNDFAVASVDRSVAHSGNGSLRIDFTGRDTTLLDGQAKQLVVLRPGVHYRLQCYTRADRLETPEGPRVVITDASTKEIASSAPLSSGSSDWREIAIDFTAPPVARAAVLTIKRVPQFVFDSPTRGTVWFDDFVLSEQPTK